MKKNKIMLDGLCITKELNGQNINTSSLNIISSSEYGTIYKMKVSSFSKFSSNAPIIRLNNNKLKFEGSLPYLINNNNMKSLTLNEIRESFKALSLNLNVDLNDAIVNYFEFGTSINIPFSFKEFIHHHLSLKKMDTADYKNKGRYFQDKLRRIKIYDAGLNANYKLSLHVKSMLNTIGSYYKNENYLKFEILYKNPYKYFGKTITVEDLLDIDFYGICAEDLLSTYCEIQKTGFKNPLTAKELTSTKILAIVLKEIEQITGIDVETRVEKTIKNSKNLQSTHKYDRRKVVKKAFSELKINDNPFDISKLLRQSIEFFFHNSLDESSCINKKKSWTLSEIQINYLK